MMVGPGMPSHDGESREELAAIAALEGLGVLSDSQRALVDEERVRELEHAAGALFMALGRAQEKQAPNQIVDRLEDVLSAQAAADAQDARHRGHSHLHDTLRDVPQRAPQAPFAPRPTPQPQVEPEAEPDGDRQGSDLAGEMPASDAPGPLSPGSSSGSSSGASSTSSSERPLLRLTLLGGWLAAAALLVATIAAYGRVSSLEATFGAGSPELRRSEMIATAADVEVLPWTTEGVSGDVTWSAARNAGFMRIEGLAINDPSVSQYQLWIFRGSDSAAEAHPVSGGVFDVSGAGEVIIPIDAQLQLGRAGLFAVTVEEPGGVMVSKREQVVLIAARA